MLGCVGTIIEGYNALVEKNSHLAKENAKLKRLLKKYDNPHSPPRTRDKKVPTQQTDDSGEPKKKPGGQPKHRGTTTVLDPNYECVGEFLEKCECGECMVKDVKVDGEKRVSVDYKVEKRVTEYTPTSATCVGCGKKRKGKYYNLRIRERSAVPAPPVAEVEVQEHTEPEVEVQVEPEQEAAVTAQKTPVPQAPANSDLRRSEIIIPKFGMFGMTVILAILTFWDSRSVSDALDWNWSRYSALTLGRGQHSTY